MAQSELPALVTSASAFLENDFDYVIVGGGTAGLAIAARLTENPDVRVGVLEAGPSRLNDPLVDTPAYFLQMLGNADYDYKFMSEPQQGNRGKIHHMPRGKMLGGSSGINYMMYVRGSDADYDDWASITSDSTWSSKNMKQYMRKHQTLEPINSNVTDSSTMPFVGENHGTSGPVRTSFNESLLPIEDDIIKAADEAAGLSHKPIDPWSGDHIGFYRTLAAVTRTGPNKGKRSYAARGYFEANAQRPNLKVLCDALVSRIVLDGNTATGVEFSHSGQKHTVKFDREVIVSCGTIQSPQILELSGIGDPRVLKAAGVECRIENLGVGNNLNDHVLSGFAFDLQPGNMSLDAIHLPGVLEAAQKEMMETKGGPLTNISSCQGFFPYNKTVDKSELDNTVRLIRNTKDATPFVQKQMDQVVAHLENDKSANLQLVAVSATANYETGAQDQSNLFPGPETPGGMGIFLANCLQYPVSRGSVHIKSTDPSQHPRLDPGYLAHEADVAVLAGGMKFIDKLCQSSHLKDKLGRRRYPDPKLDLQNMEDAKTAVRDWVIGEYHPAGTCSMGEVVDSKLIVKGTTNIRVADASVFPNHVSGNIVSSVYMVAERAADIIKETYDYGALNRLDSGTQESIEIK